MTQEMIELLECSFLADLYDALEIEKDPEVIEAIRKEIASREVDIQQKSSFKWLLFLFSNLPTD